MAKVKTYAFDTASLIGSEEAVSVFLEEALATNDPAFVAHALGIAARACGMARVAKKAGLSRESLYRALSADGNPEFATVLRVVEALGLKLTVAPAE